MNRTFFKSMGNVSKMPVSGFKWKNNTSKLEATEFIKNFDELVTTGYILEVDVKYPKNLWFASGFTIIMKE